MKCIVSLRPRRSWLSLTLAVVVGAIVAGCGSSHSTATNTTSAGAATASTGSKTAGSAAKRVSVGFVNGQTDEPFYQTAALGAKAAGTQDGHANVVVQGPTVATAQNYATVAQNLETSLQPDGFAANPCIPTAWTALYPKLATEVPNGNLLNWQCFNNVPQVKTFVGASQEASGALTAQTAIQSAHLSPSTTGTALIAQCVADVPPLVAQAKGAVATIRRLLPKIKIVSFITALAQSPNTAAWTSELSKESNVVYAMGVCDPDTQSLLTLKSRAVGGTFVAGVVQPNAQEAQAIASGKLAGGVSGLPWVQGNVATHLLIDGGRGHALPEGWVNTGLLAITKKNAAQYAAAVSSNSAADAFFAPIAQKILTNVSAVTKPMSAYHG